MSTYSIWGGVVPPSAGVSESPDSAPLTLATRFTVSQNLRCTAIRYYHGAGWDNVRGKPAAVGLYDDSGTLLSSTSTIPAIATGWNDVTIPQVDLASGNTYRAAVFYDGGASLPAYSAEGAYFTSDHVNGPFTATLGLFNYSSSMTFPTGFFNNASYFSDLLASDAVSTTLTLTGGGAATAASYKESRQPASITGAGTPSSTSLKRALTLATVTGGGALGAGVGAPTRTGAVALSGNGVLSVVDRKLVAHVVQLLGGGGMHVSGHSGSAPLNIAGHLVPALAGHVSSGIAGHIA